VIVPFGGIDARLSVAGFARPARRAILISFDIGVFVVVYLE
jgi:hypothetical protein